MGVFKTFWQVSIFQEIMFSWQDLFCCKTCNEPEQDLTLEGYCFEMCRGYLFFHRCLGEELVLCVKSGGKLFWYMESFRAGRFAVFMTQIPTFSAKNKCSCPAIYCHSDKCRSRSLPDWGVLPRSQEPLAQDCRERFPPPPAFSKLYKQISHPLSGYKIIKCGR